MVSPKSVPLGRLALIQDLDAAFRRVTAQSVLLSQAVAVKAGLTPSDLESLDLLNLEGPTTPSRLAAVTGLTSGAVTMLIDRLERAGYVRRLKNRDDARSVLVEIRRGASARLLPLYEPLGRAMSAVNDAFTDAQLAVVRDYLTRAHEAGTAHLGWLKVSSPLPRPSKKGVSHVSRPHRRPAR